MNKYLLLLFLVVGKSPAAVYVDVNGLPTNNGSIDSPLASITQAIGIVQPGDTIFVRGGEYILSQTINISSSKDGNDSLRYFLLAYDNEKVLLDFSSQDLGAKGLTVNADYWYIKGFEIKGSGDNGMQISGGSFNTIENCSFYDNRDTGLQLSAGASYNQIINCDSYYNADPPDFGDADGFAPKLDVGTGNYFFGCRAWANCDDGWDGYMRGADSVFTTLENCWTWGNGYFKDGSDPGTQANGNGFKMGGGDNSNSDLLMHHFTLINCLSFGNKSRGFDQNNNVGSMTLINCTAYQNAGANYRIQRELNPGQMLTIKNSLSYNGLVQLGNFATQENNSWTIPIAVNADDFVSLEYDTTNTRKEDFSLPDLAFLHLAESSDLIDAGVLTGFPYKGNAPDLGAFESDFTTGINVQKSLPGYDLFSNYPNPFNLNTIFRLAVKKAGDVSITIFNSTGQKMDQITVGFLNPGQYTVPFNADNYSSGCYYAVLNSGTTAAQVQKIILIK